MGSERHVKHFRFKKHFFLPPIRLAEVCGMKYRWLQRTFYAMVNYALSALLFLVLFLSSVSKTLHYLFASFYLDISTTTQSANLHSHLPSLIISLYSLREILSLSTCVSSQLQLHFNFPSSLCHDHLCICLASLSFCHTFISAPWHHLTCNGTFNTDSWPGLAWVHENQSSISTASAFFLFFNIAALFLRSYIHCCGVCPVIGLFMYIMPS